VAKTFTSQRSSPPERGGSHPALRSISNIDSEFSALPFPQHFSAVFEANQKNLRKIRDGDKESEEYSATEPAPHKQRSFGSKESGYDDFGRRISKQL
jgi:hypothetical protein